MKGAIYPAIVWAVAVMVIGANANAGEIRLNEWGYVAGEDLASPWLTVSTVKTPAGMAQFTSPGEGLGTIISLSDSDGRSFFEKPYRQTINLQLSSNHRYAAFQDRDHLIVLDLTCGREQFYPPATVFAIDDFGKPALYWRQMRSLVYENITIPMDEEILRLVFFENQPVLITRSNVLHLTEDNRLEDRFRFSGQFFDAQAVDGNLYVVERNQQPDRWLFTLYRSDDLRTFTILEQIERYRPGREVDSHQRIRCPLHYWWNSFNSLVSNSYAQIQEWGSVYLHPGIDLFEAPDTEVYAVKDGIVRIIFTTLADEHWRTAIESLDHPGEGYLYAHLNQNSFVYAVGDTVAAGSVIGALFPAYSFSPHCHFARIRPATPGLWNGSWWTVDNPLGDIVNMTDTIPPVIENALGASLFAFRSPAGAYLNPANLSGQIEIIAKCVDYAHAVSFNDRIPIHDVGFRIYAQQNPDSVVYSKFSFSLDMPLDTYFGTSYQMRVLNTMYSRDAVCFSTNNNAARDFFFILTNSDGDAFIEPEDSLQMLDTERLDPGPYLLEVVAQDASRNRASATMPIVITGAPASAPDDENSGIMAPASLISCFPNPFNASAQIRFELPQAGRVEMTLFDLAGRQVIEIVNGWLPAGTHQVKLDARSLASGVYIYRVVAGESHDFGQMVMVK